MTITEAEVPLAEMKDEQRGQFYGLGIQITKRGPDKPLTIIAPIDDTPASRAGLQAGDVIFKIEGEETIGMTVQQAVRRLKGDRGTPVTITIQRTGEQDFFDVTLYRDAIPTKSLPLAYLMAPETGFIRISNFTSTTGAAVLLIATGLASALTDIPLIALVQQRIPSRHLAKALGLWEAGVAGALAVSPFVASTTIALTGVKDAFLLSGAALVVLAMTAALTLARMDRAQMPGQIRIGVPSGSEAEQPAVAPESAR